MFALKLPDMTVNEKEVAALEDEVTTLVAQGERVAAMIHTEDTANAAAAWNSATRRKLKDYKSMSYAGRMLASLKVLVEETKHEVDRFTGPVEKIISTVDTAIGDYLSGENKRRKAIEDENRRIAREQEQQQKINAAIKLEEMGATKLADQILDAPLQASGPSIPKAKIANSVMKTVWEVDQIDKRQLIKAVAEGRVSMNALDVNVMWLKREANDAKGDVKIDGVTFKSVEKFNTRS